MEFEQRKARERQGERSDLTSAPVGAQVESPGRVSEKLAEKAGVGRRSVERAIKVREGGIPEVNEAVAKGEVSLNMAEKIAKLNPSAQRRVIETPAPQRGDALQEALNRSDAAARRHARDQAPVISQPATPFVRKFLSAIERLAMLCAEEGVKDGSDIAKKFMDEMDWESLPLTLQLERAEHHAKRKEVWEAMRAADDQSEKVFPIESKRDDGKGHRHPEFASETAAVTGKDKSTINRAIRRATEVCQDARDLIPACEFSDQHQRKSPSIPIVGGNVGLSGKASLSD